MHTLRMLAYRAETAMALVLAPQLDNPETARSLLQAHFHSDASLLPDPAAGTVTVRLLHQAGRAQDPALAPLPEQLNQPSTVFPGTQLQLAYEPPKASSQPPPTVLTAKSDDNSNATMSRSLNIGSPDRWAWRPGAAGGAGYRTLGAARRRVNHTASTERSLGPEARAVGLRWWHRRSMPLRRGLGCCGGQASDQAPSGDLASVPARGVDRIRRASSPLGAAGGRVRLEARLAVSAALP